MWWAHERAWAVPHTPESVGSKIEDVIAHEWDKSRRFPVSVKFLNIHGYDTVSPDLISLKHGDIIHAVAITGSSRFIFEKLNSMSQGYYVMESTMANLEEAAKRGFGTTLLYYDAAGRVKILDGHDYNKVVQGGREKRLYKPGCFRFWLRIDKIRELALQNLPLFQE